MLDGQEMPGMVAHTIISAPGRLRQEDGKLKASLGYIVKCCLKGKKKVDKKWKQSKCPLTEDWIKTLLYKCGKWYKHNEI